MGEMAVQTKSFVQAQVGGKEIAVNTPLDRSDKYGRWLAVMHYLDSAGTSHDLDQELLELGLAVVFMRTTYCIPPYALRATG